VLEQTAERACLPERGHKLLRKARKIVDSMVATLAFVWSMLRLELDQLDVEQETRERIERQLVAACYLKRVAAKAPAAEARNRVLECAAELRAAFETHHAAWHDLEPE